MDCYLILKLERPEQRGKRKEKYSILLRMPRNLVGFQIYVLNLLHTYVLFRLRMELFF
jgi:hypothetical protein